MSSRGLPQPIARRVEIATKAVKAAIANGWEYADNWWQVYDSYGNLRFERRSSVSGPGDYCDIEKVIYDHEFAKALWGDAFMTEITGGYEHDNRYHWEYHLQQMVVADDPIQYLAEHLPESAS